MTGRLDGKVALITGAGSGIGQAAAELFAAEGAAVVVADLRAEAAEETALKITKGGGKAIAVPVDVAVAEQAESAVARAVAEFGRLDVLYNNAGVDSSGSVAEATEADWDRCFAVNVKGTFLCSRAAVPRIAESGGGAIINQGSVAALVGIRNFAAYCAAKGAVVSLTRSMALDLASHRIRVNAICPGTVFTPLMEPMLRARGGGDLEAGLAMTVAKYPIGRLGTPEEIARVALFLASDDSSFLTGSIVTADGGMTAQ
ncbi:3-oxoacyl-ACP reductase [Carbonactinospora thermoautotrophica]|uniref:3-oxoacyl-(Acyl-carrier-protein) reductase n=1 Tax=Carbonactinospora thermoautotrophica TaxID=1469144 RepID=A0A132N3K2_9ACTN|nr:glucose 1-dehydrogenase [Carbonactinospora thermoautotrophica]KWX01049.1 3-oxoacyl-(Acyl-carrier-protein) reductase [Carbonactinospora thermoautotrophica]KWX04721.1 oxidoreductase [Carbonactinospora thermoautotrophica]KWX05201.1 oxidoreductase [Carbonactinospora thermoautotrophica]MCX9192243.1 3-oxoacyl-ACP reductase [Carbonactinospora thermoautotrophica]